MPYMSYTTYRPYPAQDHHQPAARVPHRRSSSCVFPACTLDLQPPVEGWQFRVGLCAGFSTLSNPGQARVLAIRHEIMSTHIHDDSIDPQSGISREGLFDAQLSFSVPFVEAPQPIKTIIKRDGREVSFEKRKIADAIFKAAQAANEADIDEAESLASGVTIFLSKRIDGAPPTVDQVHDAVERVLIELGHPKTALAYARYRDRRSRIRKLREGDVRGFLTEFEEAQRERGEIARPGEVSLYVLRGDERFDDWNREKIVDALTRETEIDRATATLIAMEVERQIISAKVESPTASLVRELVDAKLVEFGLEEYRRRHMRLGVPLYDAEQIICMPNQTVGQPSRDPASTDAMLAERVKKEFALTQIFSREVVDAHFAGDIYIHSLGQVDRLLHSVESLELVSRFGAASTRPGRSSRPPADSDALCVQLAQHSAELLRHYSGGIVWNAINVFAAPLLPNAGDGTLEDFAFQMLAHLAAGNLPSLELSIHPILPTDLAESEAVGPAGIALASHYSDFTHTAQRLAWHLLDAFQDGDADVASGRMPTLCVHFNDAFFQHPGHERLLTLAAETALRRGEVTFEFDRGQSVTKSATMWQPNRVVVHDVTLNLPRAAYTATTEDDLMRNLQHALRTAVLAHVQKAQFIARLLTWKDMGPLSLLARDYEGQHYLEASAMHYLVSITGLNECVQHMTGTQMHEAHDGLDLANRICIVLKEWCTVLGDEFSLRIELADAQDTVTANRLAMLDLQRHAAPAKAVIKTGTTPHDVAYTPGVRMAAVREVSPMQRLRLEGLLQQHLFVGAGSKIALPDPDLSVEAIAAFIRTAHHRTHCSRFTFAY